MINTKFLFLFSVFVLLAGCAAPPCNPPGHRNYGVFCHYKLEILDVDKSQNKVTAKVPQEVLNTNRADDPKDEDRKYENYQNLEYIFYLDNASLINKGTVVEFHKKADDMVWGRLELGRGE